jgi:hypothetical protein
MMTHRFSLAQAFMPGIAAAARAPLARFSGLTEAAALAIITMWFRG